MAQPDDDKRRDEVLKRMLATPPKPHDDSKVAAKKSKANIFYGETGDNVDHDAPLEKKEGGGVPATFSRPKPTR